MSTQVGLNLRLYEFVNVIYGKERDKVIDRASNETDKKYFKKTLTKRNSSMQLKILVSLVLCLWLLSSTISLGIIMSNVSNISDTILNADKIKQQPKQRVEMQIRRMSEIKIAGV